MRKLGTLALATAALATATFNPDTKPDAKALNVDPELRAAILRQPEIYISAPRHQYVSGMLESVTSCASGIGMPSREEIKVGSSPNQSQQQSQVSEKDTSSN